MLGFYVPACFNLLIIYVPLLLLITPIAHLCHKYGIIGIKLHLLIGALLILSVSCFTGINAAADMTIFFILPVVYVFWSIMSGFLVLLRIVVSDVKEAL